jgi:hypothetical protein
VSAVWQFTEHVVPSAKKLSLSVLEIFFLLVSRLLKSFQFKHLSRPIVDEPFIGKA